MVVLLVDNFNRADTASGLGVASDGHTWVGVDATCRIVSNRVAFPSSPGTFPVQRVNVGVAVYTVEVTASTIAGGADAALVVRWQDDGRMFFIYSGPAVGGKYSITKSVGGGTYQFPLVTGVAPANGDRIKVVVAASTIELIVNGISLGTVTDSDYNANTYVGFTTANSTSTTFDDLYVYDATAAPDAVEATLVGVRRRRASAFEVDVAVPPAHLDVAGVRRHREGAFAIASLPPDPALSMAGVRRRRVATITAQVSTPVVDSPIVAAGHSVVVAQAFGPVTMQGAQPVYSISQAAAPRARQRIVVDGVDVTYFRGCITPPVTYTLLEPLLYGPATLDLPQVAACFERLGVGALSWLRKGAPVEVHRVVDNQVVGIDWKGFVVAFDTSGRTLSVELGGEANGRAALRNRQVPIFPRINDIGHQIADSILDLGLPFEPRLGPTTGIEVMTTGGTGHLDHVQSLVAKAWTRAGRQWTVMPDEDTGVYELHRKNDTRIDGTVFLDDARTVQDLRSDIAEEPNRIYPTAVTPTGQRVRFGVYPGLVQGKAPDFPGHMGEGDSGPGVRMLIIKLQAMGYLKLADAAGGYDGDVVRAVTELQDDAGLLEEGAGVVQPGEVDLATWRALYDLDVTGLSAETAHIEPAAQRRSVREWKRSGSGNIMGPNPDYDPSVVKVDRNIDMGAAGLNRSQVREFAQTELHDALDDNWVGTITFHTGALVRGDGYVGMDVTPDKVMDARELRPGMNLDLPQFAGGILVHVAACEVDEEGVVTATVDTRFRDAMEVWEVMARNAESRRDPARSRQRAHRASTITKDSIGEWDEIGGLVGQDVELDDGWTVFPVVAAMEGTIARLRVQTTPAAEFVVAVFGDQIGPGRLRDLVGDPLSKAGSRAWSKEATRQTLTREHELLYVAGDRDQPCGYWPKTKSQRNDDETAAAPLTGKWDDEAGFAYRSRVRHMVWVAVWSDRASKIEAGRIMWPQLEAGV